jgi:hypothetical protein
LNSFIQKKVKRFVCGNFSRINYEISNDFNVFNASLAFQPINYIWDQKKSQSSVIFVEQKLINGRYERKSLVLDFNDMTEPKDMTKMRKIPEFIAQIADNIYINGILNYYHSDQESHNHFDAIVLVNIKGVNKFCIIPEFDESNVRHSKVCLLRNH